MSEKEATQAPEKTPTVTEGEQHHKKPHADVFHPHKDGHIAIGTPDTSVPHLDPGTVHI